MDSLFCHFFTFFLVLVSCRYGLGSTVRMEVLPELIDELLTDEITIRCVPEDLPQGTKGIVFMELGRVGEESLAVLKGSKLKLGTGMKNNMQAHGRIFKNASESFIQLTIGRPFIDDVSVYSCRIFYQDAHGDLKTGHVYEAVSIENNAQDDFVHLLDKVSNLETTITQLENKLTKQAGHRANGMVAFSVGLSHDEQLDAKHTLVFDNVFTNIGAGYDRVTGIFTCPMAGVYLFQFYALSFKGASMWLELHRNDNYVASIWGLVKDHYSAGGNSVTLHLTKNDKVFITTRDKTKLFGRADEVYVTFSGYLISSFH